MIYIYIIWQYNNNIFNLFNDTIYVMCLPMIMHEQYLAETQIHDIHIRFNLLQYFFYPLYDG